MSYNGFMVAQLLATKLYIPPRRPGTVPRSRLIEQLNEGLRSGHKLTLVSASAGFGKTTLVSEWITQSGLPIAWLSLDEGDNDPIRFIAYLIAALQTLALSQAKGIKAGIGEGLLAALQSRPPPSTEAILTALLNEITTLNEFLFVVDDYHVIDSGPVDGAIAFLIDHQPPHMHMVIVTREDPSLHLARLRARNQLTELRAADLRFTPAEAAEFLNQIMGLNLSVEDITSLESRTEGWIAGLQLAALSMQGHQDTAGFIKSFTGSHRFILDYLVEEVLERQSGEIQHFLLHTSILERLCGSLCESVLEIPTGSGQSTLEELERANLFIIPLDNERYWYRYHHLFGELLRQRLGQPNELPEYHLRASAWYEANADLTQAFHHAFAASDFERAACLAEMAWQGVDRSFQTAAWLGWVKKLPEDEVRIRPVLSTQMGLAFMDAGEPEASESRLRDAERCLNGPSGEMVVVDKGQLKPLPAMIAMARAYNAQVQGNLTDTVKYAELALHLIPEDDIYRRAQAVITLEITHWARGDLESSLYAIQAWMTDMQKMGNPVIVIASAFAKADLLVVLGRLHEAIRAYEQAIQLAAEHGVEAQQIIAHHHLGLALIYHELGDSESIASHLETAANLGKHTTLVDWLYRWKLAQAWLKESAGEWDAALELLDDAKRGYVKTLIPITRPVEALKARIHLKQGRMDKAASWARERGLSVTDETNYLSEYEYLTLARVRLAEGSSAGVHELLERLLALAESQKRTGSVIEILLTQALVYQAQANQPQAFATLEHVLILTEPEGYIRTFVDEGESMRLLLSDFRLTIATRDHPLLGYVDRILDCFPQSVEVSSQSKIANRKSQIVDPLTDRELEILRLVAQGLSNTEISQRLYLAVSTIKGHNLRIFNKLQVQNRTEAVAQARELGLL